MLSGYQEFAARLLASAFGRSECRSRVQVSCLKGREHTMSRLDDHLRQVDETYLEHMGHALSFSFNLAIAAVVCLVHAVFPFLFEKRGSTIVNRLHDRMVVNRHSLGGSKQEKSGAGAVASR
jgi:hypothetical protein